MTFFGPPLALADTKPGRLGGIGHLVGNGLMFSLLPGPAGAAAQLPVFSSKGNARKPGRSVKNESLALIGRKEAIPKVSNHNFLDTIGK